MKCPNCGFEAEQSPRCPICNASLAPEPAPGSAGAEFNPYAQQQNLPHRQPAQQPYPQPVRQYPQNPYQPAPVNVKKPKSAAPIVLASIAGVVILIGIIISIVSVVFFRQGFMESVINSGEESQTSSYYEDSYYNGYDSYEDDLLDKNADSFYDYTTRMPGEPCVFAYGKYTVDSVEAKPGGTDDKLFYYTVTATLENTSDEEVRFKLSNPTAYASYDDGVDFIVVSSEFEDGSDEVTLAPGKSQTCKIKLLGKEFNSSITLSSTLDVYTENRISSRELSTDCEIKRSEIKFEE